MWCLMCLLVVMLVACSCWWVRTIVVVTIISLTVQCTRLTVADTKANGRGTPVRVLIGQRQTSLIIA